LDVLLIAAEWRSRALLRAELRERGIETLAVDTWPTARQVLLSRLTPPDLVVLDLPELSEPDRMLTELAALVPADRVMVLTSPSAVSTAAIDRQGLHSGCQSAVFDRTDCGQG
jgi:hypothetical protein